MNCLPAMIGAEMPVITHGQKLSILLARASSNAPALQGLAKSVEIGAMAGDPGWAEAGTAASPTGWSRDGESVGDENDSRYRPIKKSSFIVQNKNRTFFIQAEAVSQVINQDGMFGAYLVVVVLV